MFIDTDCVEQANEVVAIGNALLFRLGELQARLPSDQAEIVRQLRGIRFQEDSDASQLQAAAFIAKAVLKALREDTTLSPDLLSEITTLKLESFTLGSEAAKLRAFEKTKRHLHQLPVIQKTY